MYEIDWEAQWAAHSPYYRDGLLHVDLRDFGFHKQVTLKLIPGPGFGDLSHPTTRLTLKLMSKAVPNQNVLDVGCGSGILAIAAVAMGAKMIYGIDIEDEALMHAKKNGDLNGLAGSWCRPEHLPPLCENHMAVMNMIRTEQQLAYQSLLPHHTLISTWITSGVLKEEKNIYLDEASKRGWKMEHLLEEEGWLGFRFSVYFL